MSATNEPKPMPDRVTNLETVADMTNISVSALGIAMHEIREMVLLLASFDLHAQQSELYKSMKARHAKVQNRLDKLSEVKRGFDARGN